MENKVQLDPALFDIPVARRVIPHFRSCPVRKFCTIGSNGRQQWRDALGKEEGLDMVGVTDRGKALHVALETKPAHERGDVRDTSDGQQAHAGCMADALGSARVEGFGHQDNFKS